MARFISLPVRLLRLFIRFCFFSFALLCLGSAARVQAQTAPTRSNGLRLQALPSAAVRVQPFARSEAFPLRPAATGDAVLFDSILDYSYDGRPDLLWGFPTRGYDIANDPYYLNSNPFGADSLISSSPAGRTAQLTLFQIGQPAQITAMTFEGALLDKDNYYAAGSIAIIFFDGVYDAPAGLPFTGSGASLTQKLAKTANGTNGYVVKFAKAAFQDSFYTVTFGTSGAAGSLFPAAAGMRQPMQINDPLGRFGVMVAAIPDTAGMTSNVWQYQKGAPNGLNRAYLYQNYNFTAAAKANSGGGHTAALAPSATGSVATSSLIPGGAAVAALTGSDLNAGKIVPVAPGAMFPTSPAMPLNPWMTFYGKKLNGGLMTTGELRGRIRNLGFDPDSAASPTSILQNGVRVPAERRANRYRFTFIAPPIDAAQYNPPDFWNPASLPPGYRIAHQQELYAQPSYGENNDGATANPPTSNTPLRLNYRLRGIPTGSYSVLAQQISIYGTEIDNGVKTLIQDNLTTLDMYPGADHISAFFPLVTILPSAQTAAGLFPDNYSGAVALDTKLRPIADMGGGINGRPDGAVDSSDFTLLIGDYNNVDLPGADPADIGGGIAGIPDGFVDSSDFTLLIGWFGGADQIGESADY